MPLHNEENCPNFDSLFLTPHSIAKLCLGGAQRNRRDTVKPSIHKYVVYYIFSWVYALLLLQNLKDSVWLSSELIGMIIIFYNFKLRVQSRNRGSLNRTYSIRSKVLGQIQKLHFLVGHHDETCRDHTRMNTNCFNHLCYLLRNLGGLRDTRHRSRYTISKHFNLVLNTLLKLYKRLLITPEPVPEDSNDYRWKYFKSIIGYPMEGSTDAIRGVRGRKRVGATTHMVWSFAEECELMVSLKDIVLRGHKCGNGFRSGY
ncbi:hypothetical protein ACS0TY_005815 [Phlomoides rotata]